MRIACRFHVFLTWIKPRSDHCAVFGSPMDWFSDRSPRRELFVVILVGCALVAVEFWIGGTGPSGGRNALPAPTVSAAPSHTLAP
jgi:hypothetical protein